jgi:hypothetical protein
MASTMAASHATCVGRAEQDVLLSLTLYFDSTPGAPWAKKTYGVSREAQHTASRTVGVAAGSLLFDAPLVSGDTRHAEMRPRPRAYEPVPTHSAIAGATSRRPITFCWPTGADLRKRSP